MTTSVNVRFSAALAQAAGTPRLQLALPCGATVGDLLDQLAANQPALADHLSHLVVAVAGRQVGEAVAKAWGIDAIEESAPIPVIGTGPDLNLAVRAWHGYHHSNDGSIPLCTSHISSINATALL
jgi:molybdopterin converting factor small subunit